LLKNAHLRRCPRPSSLRRTILYASLLGISGALHLGIFQQPAEAHRVRRGKAILSCLLNQETGQAPAPWEHEQACGQRLGLAPKLVEKTFQILGKIHQEKVTILLVEQNVYRALTLADRAYVIENGRIVMEGRGTELLKDEHLKKSYLGM
jgi:hypothetical protein